MKLDKIVLNGFKSFADKTEFNIDFPITAIVGPNGCGKSNVVDAVKWVLGNQSPKSLRSGQMSDVIFSGSSSRKPSGMAEVSLYFTQVSTLGLQQDNLQISRRLFKSGDSEYLINNNTCRLKDIRELFMDTGIGVSAYSIIEQGQIDQLLHASRTDRRTIFEEAAGISKYKAHKKEATRKLERTEQNLLRLADIIAEVAKQLRSIKLQAGKARNYLQYSNRLKELRVNFSLAEYHKLITQTNEKQNTLSEFEQKLAAVIAQVSSDDTQLSQLGSTILESEEKINRSDNALISAKSKIEQHLEKIRFLEDRINELQQRKTKANEDIHKLDVQSTNFTSRLASCQTTMQENEKLLARKNDELLELQDLINHITNEQKTILTTLEDEKSGIIDIVRRTAQLHNEIQSIGTYRNNLTGQKDRLNGRASNAESELAQLLTDKAQNQTRLDDIDKVIEELQKKLDETKSKLSETENLQKQDSRDLAIAKEQRSALTGELNVLVDMETRRHGVGEAAKAILNSKAENEHHNYDSIEGIVADVINANPDYAHIVEAALEGKTDALVINNTRRVLEDKELLGKLPGRINLISTDKIEPFVDMLDLSQYPAALGRVVEFVDYDSVHAQLTWKLLGHTILVETLNDAYELASILGPQYKFVTKNAEYFDGKDSISLGPIGKSAGLISRKSRLNQLQTELADLELKINQIQDTIEQHDKNHQHLTKLCQDFRTSIYEANTEKVNTESEINLIGQSIKRLAEEQPIIANEIEMLEQQIHQSVQNEYNSKQKLSELEEINQQRTTHIQNLDAQITEKSKLIEQKTAALTELKVQIGQITEQQKATKQNIASFQSQLQQGRSSIESIKTELAACEDQIKKTGRDILNSEAKVSDLFVEKENAQKLSTELHQQVAELLEKQKQTEEILREKREEQTQIEQQVHEVQLELSQISVRTEDLSERVREELQMELAEAYENYNQENIDWQKVQDEITELRNKIERLGNVNVDAITEQEQLQERYDFLATQVEDLNKSKSQLEQLISKINKESREKFSTTFEQVRENFQQIFRKLFGGGRADIFLEDPDDILECGIEIVARPPGKETRSISLLSGGEKTLTALGLLFAVFRTKPSPFCFLDEVDAALDEANNERFNLIVREFQKNSQFIIITHSKRTMSIADILFGVTMQTQGVSKKISVRFDGTEPETEEEEEEEVAVA